MFLRDIFTNIDCRIKRVAVLDTDSKWMNRLKKVFEEYPQASLDTYVYPEEKKAFFSKVNKYDVILVDHSLGGDNGANIVRNLYIKPITAKMLILSDNYLEDFQTFSYYTSKENVLSNPNIIFNLNGSRIDQAVEAVVLSHIKAGVQHA